MLKQILLTSFQTWLPHQISNSSDDLLHQLQQQDFTLACLHFLRQLPVDTIQASEIAIAKIRELKPDIVTCCGMAEHRPLMTIESNAIRGKEQIYTSVNLEQLSQNLSFTEISNDAGKFVCEGLYYRVLKEIEENHPRTQAIFVHIPSLDHTNIDKILQEFKVIIKYLLAP